MASESKTPPPPSGNAKYMIIGLLCLGAAGALWLVAGNEEPPPAPAPPPPPEVTRVNPMAEPMLDLEPEPDAGPEPEPEPEPEEKPKKRATGPKRDSWDCSGDLGGALKVVNSHRSQIRACYERRLKVNNILQGDLSVKVKVNSAGKVVQTAVNGSLRDNEVFRCVRSIAEDWTFAAPTGGNCAVVSVPFSFSPKI